MTYIFEKGTQRYTTGTYMEYEYDTHNPVSGDMLIDLVAHAGYSIHHGDVRGHGSCEAFVVVDDLDEFIGWARATIEDVFGDATFQHCDILDVDIRQYGEFEDIEAMGVLAPSPVNVKRDIRNETRRCPA